VREGNEQLMQSLLFALAQATTHSRGDNLEIPKFETARFFGQLTGRTLLSFGLGVAAVGLIVGLLMALRLRGLPAHKSMLEVSDLIYETCKTYLITQGKFILSLWVAIAAIMLVYFGYLRSDEYGGAKTAVILLFSLIGIAGSVGVAWFGIRVNNWANSRAAFASLRGKAYPTYAIPLSAGMSIGMLLISVELLLMLGILLFIPSNYASSCFLGFAIGESLGASGLRIAGGIFTKIADIGSDLMKIVFNIKEDDARNPGVIADCAGDNAGDSVGPTADGFETYGVTGVALIEFILLAVHTQEVRVKLMVWIFFMSVMMVIASGGSYLINQFIAKIRYGEAKEMDFEKPLTFLIWLTSIVSVVVTFVVSKLLLGSVNGDTELWWKLAAIVSCGTLAGAIIPETIKVFTSTNSGHVKEIVAASREGGASLNVLGGLTAGNFSAFWMGIVIMALMGAGYGISTLDLESIMDAPAVFSFGLIAFGFLSMGPVTIAVDSYGPVTDNAQSVYELSIIETLPNIEEEIKKEYSFEVNWERAKYLLEANDGAGNTFKATAKPVLIGTAVVGSTTMIFSIIALLTDRLTKGVEKLSILNPAFLLGLIAGGAVIYWFSGAATQAVATGAYRAVEYIKANIQLTGATKASPEDSKKVVAICTEYAQKGMLNMFLTVFFATLSFAWLDPYFFIGYLISIAIFGLFQALFMANAGGAWDNAKKVVEVELKAKGTPLHAATVVGDTVGDPFKDTSSVALNPVIKFTTLFGLLALQLVLAMKDSISVGARVTVSVLFFVAAAVFVYRSFYGMRIESVANLKNAQPQNPSPPVSGQPASQHVVGQNPGQASAQPPAQPSLPTAKPVEVDATAVSEDAEEANEDNGSDSKENKKEEATA